MTERGVQRKSDITKEGWEQADVPILCETCLGENPYVRMTREQFGQSCKTCERPFTVFRWQPGARARFKKTQICQTCAKAKNVCQTCVLDLVYGLPVEVRDSFIAKNAAEATVKAAESRVGREYQAMQLYERGDDGTLTNHTLHEGLLRIARKTPYYDRNLPHLCSFFARGECTRGDGCPFRHEMPRDKDDPLAHQNIKDRYAGRDDPVAAKIMARAKAAPALREPADESAKTLWLGGLDDTIGAEDVKAALYAYGEIISVRVVPRTKCAFVEFSTHAQAKLAAESTVSSLEVKGVKLKVNWASKPGGGSGGAGAAPLLGAESVPLTSATFVAPSTPSSSVPEAYPGQALGLPPPIGFPPLPYPPGGVGAAGGPIRTDTRGPRAHPYYPSMNPQAMGARLSST